MNIPVTEPLLQAGTRLPLIRAELDSDDTLWLVFEKGSTEHVTKPGCVDDLLGILTGVIPRSACC